MNQEFKASDGHTKRLLRFALLFSLVSSPVMLLTSCESDAPTPLRGDFSDSALQVVSLIERGHDHKLIVGKDEAPNFAVDRLRTYARNDDENFVVDKIHGLDIIVYYRAENEYYGCDAEIQQALRSRLLPKVGFPSCK